MDNLGKTCFERIYKGDGEPELSADNIFKNGNYTHSMQLARPDNRHFNGCKDTAN